MKEADALEKDLIKNLCATSVNATGSASTAKERDAKLKTHLEPISWLANAGKENSPSFPFHPVISDSTRRCHVGVTLHMNQDLSEKKRN